jgi:hypothetical protein
MATKKKTKRKPAKSKKATASKKKQPKKQARKRPAPKKSVKTVAPSKAAAKKIVVKKPAGKAADEGATLARKLSRGRRQSALLPGMLGARSAGQAGDLQGLSDVEAADSESVDELVEEGNAFEAGIVSGVEDAGRRGTKEVTTREVPEDDVPAEYLDQD